MPEFQSTRVATSALLFTLVVVVASNFPLIDSVPDTTIVVRTCSQDQWAADDPYGDNVLSTLGELVWRTPGEPYSQMEWVGRYEETTVYAEAGCEQHLDGEDCRECLGAAAFALTNFCYHNVMGNMQMMDCSMRYSNQELE